MQTDRLYATHTSTYSCTFKAPRPSLWEEALSHTHICTSTSHDTGTWELLSYRWANHLSVLLYAKKGSVVTHRAIPIPTSSYQFVSSGNVLPIAKRGSFVEVYSSFLHYQIMQLKTEDFGSALVPLGRGDYITTIFPENRQECLSDWAWIKNIV